MTKTFKELGLSDNFLNLLKEFHFKEPTEIQEKSIPLALAKKDVIGGSATGSGKTLAFGAPFIENIELDNNLQVLVLTPTRELAEQVSKSLKLFSQNKPMRIYAIYGGVSMEPQVKALQRADVVVATPGRLLDHISRRTIDLSKVNYLVLDEADRMLDMGFIDDVEKIIKHCPKERQTLLFSATISEEIVAISKKYMKNPVEIKTNSGVDPSKLEQVYYDITSNEKFSLLVHLLKEENSNLVMVFCNTKRNTDFIGRQLRLLGINAVALHGDLSQNRRSNILERFHKSEKLILVCTDVAARGLDIKNVSHVYNYDVPKTAIEYIHRIGRTARAGKEGKAVTILSDRDYENFRRILKDESLKLKKIEIPKFERIMVKRTYEDKPKRFGRDSFSGRRERTPTSRGYGSGKRSGGYGSDNRSRRYGSNNRDENRSSGRTERYNSGSRDKRYDSSEGDERQGSYNKPRRFSSGRRNERSSNGRSAPSRTRRSRY